MAFADDIAKFTVKLDRVGENLVPRIGQLTQQSIVEGSALTGAPGQPVDTGNLRNSWHLSFPEPGVAQITTHVEYAEVIEDGVGRYGPLRLRSAVGGFHSVKMTRMAFSRIVDHAVGTLMSGYQDNTVFGGSGS